MNEDFREMVRGGMGKGRWKKQRVGEEIQPCQHIYPKPEESANR